MGASKLPLPSIFYFSKTKMKKQQARGVLKQKCPKTVKHFYKISNQQSLFLKL